MSPRWIMCLCLTLVAACSERNNEPANAAPVGDEAIRFDWPQWQGPDRSTICKETGLLTSWPKDGPPLAWKVNALGEGYSTPSISQGRIFAMGNRDKTEYVICLNERDGKELWATETGPVRSNGGGYPGPRCTPTVDGDRVYAEGLNGDLVCLEAASGKVVWKKELKNKQEFDGRVGGWGYSESPLVDGDRLIVTPGGKLATLAALDKNTGKVIWRSAVPSGESAAYASIIIANVDGQKQYIQFLSRGVVGVSAADGKFLWRYDAPANGTANCTTAIYEDGHVFAASNYGVGGGLAKLIRTSSGYNAQEVYFTKKMQNHHGGMVLKDGYLYGSGPQLTCLEFKTGNEKWTGRTGKGAVLYADGHLIYRNEGGDIYLVEANPDKFVEKSKFKQPERTNRPAWPHPVIANGKLYIRDQGLLLCYDVKAKK
ncbi:MAG: PQQ-binding-like beta-propeller repeat protein [Gemmataceae bacterium]